MIRRSFLQSAIIMPLTGLLAKISNIKASEPAAVQELFQPDHKELYRDFTLRWTGWKKAQSPETNEAGQWVANKLNESGVAVDIGPNETIGWYKNITRFPDTPREKESDKHEFVREILKRTIDFFDAGYDTEEALKLGTKAARH